MWLKRPRFKRILTFSVGGVSEVFDIRDNHLFKIFFCIFHVNSFIITRRRVRFLVQSSGLIIPKRKYKIKVILSIPHTMVNWAPGLNFREVIRNKHARFLTVRLAPSLKKIQGISSFR